MRLDTIAGTNIKGRTFSHPLSPITLITGENDTGKTAIMDAVKLVLIGHHPKYGKTNGATFGMSSASKMRVAGRIEGLPDIQREWAKSGKSVKALATGVDGLPETPLVLMDAAEYFGRSDTAKVNMLFETMRLDAAQWNIPASRAKIMEALDPAAAAEQNIATLLAAKKDESVQEWLDRMQDDLAEEFKKTNGEIDRYTEMALGIASLNQDEIPVDPDRVAADQRDAATRLEELQRRLGQQRAQIQQSEKTDERRRLLQRQIGELRAELGDRELPTRTLEEILTELREKEGETIRLQERHDAEVREAQKRRKAAERAEHLTTAIRAAKVEADSFQRHNDALAKLTQEREVIGEVALARTAAQEGVNRWSTERATAAEQIRQIDLDLKAAEQRHERLVNCPACPTCGAAAGEIRAMIDNQYQATVLDLGNQRTGVERRYQDADTELKAAQESMNSALKMEARAQALERQIGDTRVSLQAAIAAAKNVETMEHELESIGDTSGRVPVEPEYLVRLRKDIGRLHDDHIRRGIADKIEATEKMLAEIVDDAPEDLDMRAAQTEDEISAVRERIEELEQMAQRAANQAADIKRTAEAQEQRVKQEKRADALKALVKAVKDTRKDLIAATFGPLLETANRFTAGILPTPLEYQNGELGRYNDGSWVSVRYFGGTYEAATFAGLQSALGATAPAKAVLVDEMGRFDAKNKRKFLHNISTAIHDGVIDQFIGIDVSAEDYDGLEFEMPGLTMLRIG